MNKTLDPHQLRRPSSLLWLTTYLGIYVKALPISYGLSRYKSHYFLLDLHIALVITAKKGESYLICFLRS